MVLLTQKVQAYKYDTREKPATRIQIDILSDKCLENGQVISFKSLWIVAQTTITFTYLEIFVGVLSPISIQTDFTSQDLQNMLQLRWNTYGIEWTPY